MIFWISAASKSLSMVILLLRYMYLCVVLIYPLLIALPSLECRWGNHFIYLCTCSQFPTNRLHAFPFHVYKIKWEKEILKLSINLHQFQISKFHHVNSGVSWLWLMNAEFRGKKLMGNQLRLYMSIHYIFEQEMIWMPFEVVLQYTNIWLRCWMLIECKSIHV